MTEERETCGCTQHHDHEHNHNHDHDHGGEWNKKQLGKIALAALFFTAALLSGAEGWPELALFGGAYLLVGGEVLLRAVKNMGRGQIFDENFLMSIATIGAFALRQYPEGVAVMLFYQVGEFFQDYAVSRSRRSVAKLMDIRPDHANWKQGEQLVEVSPEEVPLGAFIVIKPGERVPLDGKVTEGVSWLDTSALTGEALPREVGPGSEVLSGCINGSGILTAEVTKAYAQSVVARILELVENADSRKARTEKFITRFARFYTPVVVGVAVLLALLPPLFWPGAAWNVWIYRALIFLVVSCPCALVISVPLSFFAGIGAASRQGVLVKGGNYLEVLARTETMVFDKTGTLTQGVFQVREICPQGMTKEDLLELAAYAECYSNHPLAASIRQTYGRETDSRKIGAWREIAGQGVEALVQGRQVLAGNPRLMAEKQIAGVVENLGNTTIHLALEGIYAGYITLSDTPKVDAAAALKRLRQLGVKKMVLLTGDSRRMGEEMAQRLGLDEAYTELLPQDKVEKMEFLLQGRSSQGKVAFVGDGINDAPVLARADVGIAMGGLGADAAVEAADIVLMTDEPGKLPVAVDIARKTLRIARQNIVFALGIKGLILLGGVIGIATMWHAVFADVGVALLAVVNALRVMQGNK